MKRYRITGTNEIIQAMISELNFLEVLDELHHRVRMRTLRKALQAELGICRRHYFVFEPDSNKCVHHRIYYEIGSIFCRHILWTWYGADIDQWTTATDTHVLIERPPDSSFEWRKAHTSDYFYILEADFSCY